MAAAFFIAAAVIGGIFVLADKDLTGRAFRLISAALPAVMTVVAVILMTNTKNRAERCLAGTLFLILLVVQLLNAALVFGLSILGVLETWINFRKPKEFSDEDHS